MLNLLTSAEGILDAVEPVLKWVATGVIAAALVAGLIVFFVKREIFAKFAKYALLVVILLALAGGIFMLALNIAKYYGAEGDYKGTAVATYIFLPILVSLVLILVTSVTAFILSKKNSAALKKFGMIAGIVCALAIITTLVLIALFFKDNIVGDGYYTEDGKLNSPALYISTVLLVAAAIAIAFVIDRKDKSGFDTRSIAFAGISVALSFTLSYVKLWEMPQGGSVTLASMLPIMIFAYVYGAKKGVLIGFIYGILQAVQDPYIIHPAQFFLDYPVAFGLIGFAGALRNVKALDKLPQVKFALSALIGSVLRFASHVLSGVFAFGAYAGDQNFLLYSLAYNSFVFVDLAIVIVVGAILFSSKGFVTEMNRFRAATQNYAAGNASAKVAEENK